MKLLLLAFSGVRVQNSRLMELGLTLPGFVERSRVIASFPSLGLLTLAAHTPPHWEVEYREFDEFGDPEFSGIIDGDFDLGPGVASLRRLPGYPVVGGDVPAKAGPLELERRSDLCHADLAAGHAQ